MNDKKTMGKYEAPYKVAKTEKKDVDLNPQRKKKLRIAITSILPISLFGTMTNYEFQRPCSFR